MSRRLNTTAQGDNFEKKVYNILGELLRQGEFPANCKYSKIYSKHKLRSKETNRDIVFDIVIETIMPNSSMPSMIYIIECKNYKDKVKVDKIRNFCHQIEEVGAHKGFIFTTSGFQTGTYDIAKTRHVGLVRVAKDNTLDWILNKTEHSKRHEIKADIKKYIYGDEQQCEPYSFAAVYGNDVYNDIVSFVEAEMQILIPQKRRVKYLTEKEIVNAIYDCAILEQETHDKVSNKQLLAIINKLGFKYTKSKQGVGIAGHINFKEKLIVVSDCISENSHHWRFTIAHEIGHIILHGFILKSSNITGFDEYLSDKNCTNKFSEANMGIIEYQANLFAVSLLIPEKQFNKVYKQYNCQNPIRRFPYLFLDSQNCNKRLCNDVFRYMSNYFDVSVECICNYLQNKKLLTIKDEPLSISDFFR